MNIVALTQTKNTAKGIKLLDSEAPKAERAKRGVSIASTVEV